VSPAGPGAKIDTVTAAAYRIPTDAPEADGTFSWDATTLVLVWIGAGGVWGLGYTYADAAVCTLIANSLKDVLPGRAVEAGAAIRAALERQVRNLGRSGLAACAISALDIALWDLKARLLGLSLASLLGLARDEVAIYGSGGFTTYDDARLRAQLGGFVERDGCAAVKMKIGADPADDPRRMRVAREAIGDAALFIDANGALTVKQALDLAERCHDLGLRWFEEPVSSDDRAGLSLLRRRLPAPIDIAAGEYIFTLDDARLLLEAGCVDVLQADVTRCGGITGFLRIAALCEAHHIDLSGHCAPAAHLDAACAAPRLRHLEWFHDHVRIEHELFDGAPKPQGGVIRPRLDAPGHGLTFKAKDAARYLVAGEPP
jgi:L-alanine-DL-glutamate epimerase-like enolase superfamily enzyme